MKEIKKYANAAELLDELSGDIEIPVNLEKIIEFLGITVRYDASLDEDDIVGEILFEQENPIIKINPLKNRYETRMRFTLAHEIGHYCLHISDSKMEFVDSQKTMSRTESYWDRYESEANNFAAQLLMPKTSVLSVGQKVIDIYKTKKSKTGMPVNQFIETMAKEFCVSVISMEYRLKNLGITN